MDLKIKDKYALVTGGSHGIGKSIALLLAENGCNVCIFSRGKNKVDSTIKEIKNKGVDCIGIYADVFQKDIVDIIMKNIIEKWGTIDILVNNVGGGGRWGLDIIENTPFNVWEEVFYKNALISSQFTMRCIPYMMKKKWGRIVCISSIFGNEAGGRPWFNMAKSAQISLMKTLSLYKRFSENGITFNSVAPGGIFIEGTGWEKEKKNNSEIYKQQIDKVPMGRMGTPEEVANAVVFLCSELSSYINGSCLSIDGGESKSF